MHAFHLPEEIVVIAVSGRALAQSAAKLGCAVRVFDAFADRDTRAVGPTVCVASDGAIALDQQRLLKALDALPERAHARVIVVGSGFERAPHLLNGIAKYAVLCANDADIVRALKQPELGTDLLRAVGFRVPDTQRAPPVDRNGWLRKEIGGAGGVHVRRASDGLRRARCYYQREMPGEPCSVTFMADGERAWIIGFNRQSIAAIGAAPFCYMGASTCEMGAVPAATLQRSLDRLVRATELRGLNGVDFLLDGDACMVLEVNPRPTATFELYDADFAEGLVHWHIRSFDGPLAEFGVRLRERTLKHRAYAIVFAQGAMQIPVEAAFVPWMRDLPSAGVVQAGAPVLSVFADADTPALARQLLQERQQQVHAMLARWAIGSQQRCEA